MKIPLEIEITEADRERIAAEERAKAEAVTVKLVEKSFDFGEQPHASQPTIRLDQICERLGFALTADFLRHLGFEPAATDKAAKLYHDHDFERICTALVRHIQHVAQGVPA